MAEHKPLETLWTSFPTVQKKLRTVMVIRYATKSLVTYLTVIIIMASGTYKYLILVVDQAMTAPIRQLQTKVIDVSFAAPDEKVTNFTSGS